MNLQPQAKTMLATGAAVLALAVLIGAFGAHGLKNLVEAKALETFETGVRYQFYHGFGIFLMGLLSLTTPNLNLRVSFLSFVVGILLFSFNCYFYVLSGAKVFAMIVPIGGVLFVLGWVTLCRNILKTHK